MRHIGWEKCGHGLASRPRETSEPGFLNSLPQVFGYLGGSGALLLAGELPLRYCTDRFALLKTCWGLPERGHVHSLLTPAGEGVGLVEVALVVPNGGSCWITGAGGVWKKMRLARKTNSSQLPRSGDPSLLHSRRWKRLCFFGEVQAASGKLTQVVCTAPRLQVCARRFQRN